MSLIALLAVAAATTASGPPQRGVDTTHPNSWEGVVYAPTPFTVSADKTFHDRMVALRSDAIAQQASDGGTLTPEHRAQLQNRLDRIRLRYAEVRRRADLFSVDAAGRAVYSAGTRPRYAYPPNTIRKVGYQ